MLFVDSDIYFRADSILKMLKKDEELMSIPYPLKTMMWDKLYKNGTMVKLRALKIYIDI
jgi:hypothetical protein